MQLVEIKPSIIDQIKISTTAITGEKVLALYNKIKDDINWNDKMELILRNKLLPGTNVVRLLIYACKQRKLNENVPHGWGDFARFLGQTVNDSNGILNDSYVKTINRNDVKKINQWETLA